MGSEMPFMRDKIDPKTNRLIVDQDNIDDVMQRAPDWTRQIELTAYLLRSNHKFTSILAVIQPQWINQSESKNWGDDGRALKDAINFVRKGGIIVMFGVPSKGAKVDLDMSGVYSKGITIVNSYAASDFDTKEAVEKISNKQINVSQLITHKYNLEECQQAFVHAKSGDNAMKIIISN